MSGRCIEITVADNIGEYRVDCRRFLPADQLKAALNPGALVLDLIANAEAAVDAAVASKEEA